jgi:hypothetical protein
MWSIHATPMPENMRSSFWDVIWNKLAELEKKLEKRFDDQKKHLMNS